MNRKIMIIALPVFMVVCLLIYIAQSRADEQTTGTLSLLGHLFFSNEPSGKKVMSWLDDSTTPKPGDRVFRSNHKVGLAIRDMNGKVSESVLSYMMIEHDVFGRVSEDDKIEYYSEPMPERKNVSVTTMGAGVKDVYLSTWLLCEIDPRLLSTKNDIDRWELSIRYIFLSGAEDAPSTRPLLQDSIEIVDFNGKDSITIKDDNLHAIWMYAVDKDEDSDNLKNKQ